jgi:hypothetical protein
VPINILEDFWTEVETIFTGLIFTRGSSFIIRDLVNAGTQIIFYVSYYKNITDNSFRALPGCWIDNQLGDHVFNETGTLKFLDDLFNNSTIRRADDITDSKLYLLSMSASAPSTQLWTTALLDYQPFFTKKLIQQCAKSFNLNMKWCPLSLLEISKLTNYYNQISLDYALKNNKQLPMVIYIDNVGINGIIPTNMTDNQNNQYFQGFSYVDTLLLVMVNNFQCISENCKQLKSLIVNKQQKYPLFLWNDNKYGRVSNFSYEI